jgi:hypothetical protein
VTTSHVVGSPQAAATLAAGRGTTYLQPYFDQPTSIAEAARSLAKPLARVHYWTHRWHDLGILEVAEVIARKGRPIRRYRTVADVIEVPPQLLPHSLFEQQLARANRELVAGMEAAVPEVTLGGLLRIHKPPGEHSVTTDRTLDGPRTGRGDVLQCNFTASLDREEAAQLRQELEQLRDRWTQKAGRLGAGTHLVALAITPLAP